MNTLVMIISPLTLLTFSPHCFLSFLFLFAKLPSGLTHGLTLRLKDWFCFSSVSTFNTHTSGMLVWYPLHLLVPGISEWLLSHSEPPGIHPGTSQLGWPPTSLP